MPTRIPTHGGQSAAGSRPSASNSASVRSLGDFDIFGVVDRVIGTDSASGSIGNMPSRSRSFKSIAFADDGADDAFADVVFVRKIPIFRRPAG